MAGAGNNQRQHNAWTWLDSAGGGLLLIALLGMLVYGHTLRVPWYFDDFPNIVDNGSIRDLRAAATSSFGNRSLALLTFALNYQVHGLQVGGYHVVNLTIHIATAWLVLLILRRVFRDAPHLPLLGALLFLVHPLQTQAVTYIVQRMTCLAGFCFFLALYCYIRAQETLTSNASRSALRYGCFYGAALLCGALAVLTKQNTAILPLCLWLFTRYFLPQSRISGKKSLLILLPFCLAPLALAIQQVILPLSQGTMLGGLGRPQDLLSSTDVSPLHYLVTEFSVLWLYLRLLVLPYGQALDYGYPIVAELWTGRNLLALAGLLGLLWGAFRLRRLAPLISFGCGWFLLTLTVESTLIPLDPVYEHRLYLPMFGFVVAAIGLLQLRCPARALRGVLLVLIVLLSTLAWQRNALWNDPVAFFEDNARRAPNSERVYGNLAKAYLSVGRRDDAIAALQHAIAIAPNYPQAYLGLGAIYADLGQPAKAIASYQQAIALLYDYPLAHYNLGVLYYEQGQLRQAQAEFSLAATQNPRDADALFNLAVTSLQLGQTDQARQLLPSLQALQPGLAEKLRQELDALR